MMNKSVQSNYWKVGSLLLAVFLLLLAAAAVMASDASRGNKVPNVSYNTGVAPCDDAEAIVLGREGGLLSLLDANGYAAPVEAIVKGEGYTRQAVESGHVSNHITYIRTDC